jgi:hypothetical protein
MPDCEIGNLGGASKVTGDSDIATKKSRMAELVLMSNSAKSDSASGEHLVIDKGSSIYNEIDTMKLEQNATGLHCDIYRK